jgi:hypothetical protein
MGTAISSDQLGCKNCQAHPGGRVILCSDNDEAGQIKL